MEMLLMKNTPPNEISISSPFETSSFLSRTGKYKQKVIENNRGLIRDEQG